MHTPHLNPDATLLFSRLLLSALFLQSGVSKSFAWNDALDELHSFGLPRSPALLLPALALQLLGGLALVLGLFTFWAGLALIAFLVPTTLLAHGFWRYAPPLRAHHVTGFFQNLTICGGLTLILHTGPGALSLDARLAAPPNHQPPALTLAHPRPSASPPQPSP